MKRLDTYSQNFLRSPRLVESLLAQSTIKDSDVVYDIGAGSGVITSVLARKAKQVVAIEFEPHTAEILKKNMAEYNNVTVIVSDILKFSFPTTPYKIVANIPFHLSSPIIQQFINTATAPQAAYLIVQKQFGRKLEATDTTHFTSQLGMIIGAEYKVKVIKNLQKTDFYPRPAVDTVWIELLKRQSPLVAKGRLKAYQTFTIECFQTLKSWQNYHFILLGRLPECPRQDYHSINGCSYSQTSVYTKYL